MSDELVREALREGTRVIVRAEVTPAGTPRIGTSSRIGTPRMGTPVVGTPIIGTPVLGTPFSGTPTSRRKNLAQCQLRALPQEEEEEAEVRIERKVELSTYVELEPEQRHLSLFHLVKSLLGCTRVAQGKHIRESGRCTLTSQQLCEQALPYTSTSFRVPSNSCDNETSDKGDQGFPTSHAMCFT